MGGEEKTESGIFCTGPDWWYNAILGRTNNSWRQYVDGYRLAADFLVDSIPEDTLSIDKVVFPIVFLYRHYLEIGIKASFLEAELLNGDKPQPIKDAHDLAKALERLEKSIGILFRGMGKETPELAPLKAVVSDFTERDKSSMVFRFPTGKEGQPYDVPEQINLRILKEGMSEAAKDLEALAFGFDCLDYEKRETESLAAEALLAEMDSGERDAEFNFFRDELIRDIGKLFDLE